MSTTVLVIKNVLQLPPVTLDSFKEPICLDTVYQPAVPGTDALILRIPPYRFKPAKVALSVNILLPKKPHLQRCFEEHLDLGFDIEKVKTFLSDSQNQNNIHTILADYPVLRN